MSLDKQARVLRAAWAVYEALGVWPPEHGTLRGVPFGPVGASPLPQLEHASPEDLHGLLLDLLCRLATPP
ncbi:MAG: hypothetical protein AAF750_16845, partial [Planctomycetota bacterium]